MRKKLEEYIADNPAIIIVILLLAGLAVVALIPERVMGAFFVILKFLLNAFLVLLIAAAVLLFFIHSAKNMIRAIKAKAVRENLSVFAIPIFAFIVIALATFFGGWMAACVALIPLAPLAYIYWVTSDVVEKSEPKKDVANPSLTEQIIPTPTDEDAPPAWSDGDKYL